MELFTLDPHTFLNQAPEGVVGNSTQIWAEANRCYHRSNWSLCYWPQYNWIVDFKTIFLGHILYAAVLVVLYPLMQNAKPLNLKWTMRVYNVIQLIVCGFMTVGLAPYLLYGFYNMNGTWNSTIEFWILVHHASKYVDMLDTVFILLRKKHDQFSFLHVYHHLTIGVIWGTLLHYGIGNGAVFFGAWINSLVHVIMYFHYFWTSFGLNNPLKRYLTMFQMLQFFLCNLQSVIGSISSFVYDDSNSPIVYPTQPRWCVLQSLYNCSLLFLFYQFLKASDKKKKQSQKKAE